MVEYYVTQELYTILTVQMTLVKFKVLIISMLMLYLCYDSSFIMFFNEGHLIFP